MQDLKKHALDYHAHPVPGKIHAKAIKRMQTRDDLSLAYSPGVAYPCLEIVRDAAYSYEYTARGNTVAVITDGSAVLGLGDIGPLASMPVMEGKCMLLERFAGISGIPLTLKKSGTSEEFARLVANMANSFGAINLEDIKAPDCFEIETSLQKMVDIPVFHDDQHGTAIVSLAGLLTSLSILGKKIPDVSIVVSGAGAAGIACLSLYEAAGIKKEQMMLVDSRGVVYSGRTEGMNDYKAAFAQKTAKRTLEEALKGADVFVGVSRGNTLTRAMVKGMGERPVIFALANPDPEILPSQAKEAGAVIVATGRSDFPNQVNNALGFPGIFRGALDVMATEISREMKLAAADALYRLSLEPVPADVKEFLSTMYPEEKETMKNNTILADATCIVPKLFDPRVAPRLAAAVARSAMETRIAKRTIADLNAYEKDLRKTIGMEKTDEMRSYE